MSLFSMLFALWLTSFLVPDSAGLMQTSVEKRTFNNSRTSTALSFMANGDWGGEPYWPYTNLAQLAVAHAMGEQAGKIDAKFTLLLGDNFYYHGVESVDDPRWVDGFEHVFTSKNLQSDHHFRVIAGNHDDEGNVSAQILYSSKSPRWFFPSRYYEFEEVTSDMRVHFVMIDTNILKRETPESQRHWAWLRNVLANSSADFLVVAGHHPVWSSCKNGPTRKLLPYLKPLLEESNVSVYLAGHDHCAEHIEENGVQYHTNGAGSGFEARGHRKRRTSIPWGLSKWLCSRANVNTGGFIQGVADPILGLTLSHSDSDGTILYTAPPIKSRQARTEVVKDEVCTGEGRLGTCLHHLQNRQPQM
jgi:tartrate-resistant acid phosphatase type 5